MANPVFGTVEIKDVHQMKDGRILAYHNETVCNIIILKRIHGEG